MKLGRPLQPGETPQMIVCCRTSDSDPSCVVVEGHVLGTCCTCNEEVRIGKESFLAIATHGAQPWCVQCIADLPKGSVIFRDNPFLED